ncbi:uncharacterized protein LOC115212406 [Argonauta hians]
MPPKRGNKLSGRPKCKLDFMDSPKEIPHGLLSPIHCGHYKAGAHLTDFNNLLWVSPQFTGIKESQGKTRRRRNLKPSCENDYPKEDKKYQSLQFVKPKSRTAFGRCQSLTNIDVVIAPSPKFTTSTNHKGKEIPPWKLFENSPLPKKELAKVLVPDTPESEYGLSVRLRQLSKIRKK